MFHWLRLLHPVKSRDASQCCRFKNVLHTCTYYEMLCVFVTVHMPQWMFLFVLSSAIVSCSASLTQLCVCGLAVCSLCFPVSHWVISALVIAIATMLWHMPASWLPDWQDCCRGEIQRMLEQITALPLPSSEWQSVCRVSLPLVYIRQDAVKEKQARFLH